ncbi:MULTISPECIES: peptidase M3 [unclassified Clostridioides]|uniref:peptidase M3 n=1 Tax=unclassified Clostridioides TaxID=2635829 RepID=UPI001D109E6F|nr:peptidase M3 [Clostridioides sp. ZZV14-6150]MCC0661393.1 peptidase M3 [Clostridioides sp. ZZV14-6154]MCC0668727.1 peptidase M3 [Clostridioides sp. ZZV14-6153]MCC0717981.1 peptidase M3 [Clostridioides sp. ZZV14-6105]MCC0721933.1 peptidase M3 [Clostridioides sp. ZZV14-6104]MCC0726042.1 peptidase M3 [Clostridioides sp. ZZV14-6045]MCC0735111.1 peptidase M3 [Clostridioides sp. ZZV14-6009]MCC0738891.1 peptidase M3 [Clostridioides sp. ZZV14-5902]MCC0743835.1 peptidase M3 [Clostridioides sp. ZZV
MIKSKKRLFISLILIVIFIIFALYIKNYTNDSKKDSVRGTIPFEKMEYKRPDIKSVCENINTYNDKLLTCKNAKEQLNVFNNVDKIYQDFYSTLTIAKLRNNIDSSDEFYSKEYKYLMSKSVDVDMAYKDFQDTFVNSKFSKELKKEIGKDGFNYLKNIGKLNSEEVENLLKKEQDLVVRYEDLLSKSTVSVDGMEIDFEEAMSKPNLSYEEYVKIYSDYLKKYNPIFGNIFLELVQTRTEIATKLGFKNYTDYAYLNLNKDYSQEDARKFRSEVKEYIVPLYMKVTSQPSDSSIYIKAYKNRSFRKFDKVLEDISPKLKECFNYMKKYDLYDYSSGKNKSPGGYTTYINKYKAPFLFNTWDNSFLGVTSFAHEFGHFYNYYNSINLNNTIQPSIDICEVHSTSLEILFYKYFDEFFGKQSEAIKKEHLSIVLNTIIDACLYDEFQEIIYKNPYMSLNDINKLFFDLEEEYGVSNKILKDKNAPFWILVSHNFQVPFYYLSYGLASDVSLQIWELSQDDYRKAVDVYMDFLNQNTDAGFKDVVEKVNLQSPFESGNLEEISSALYDYFGLENPLELENAS